VNNRFTTHASKEKVLEIKNKDDAKRMKNKKLIWPQYGSFTGKIREKITTCCNIKDPVW
jgi:hypothetical protein